MVLAKLLATWNDSRLPYEKRVKYLRYQMEALEKRFKSIRAQTDQAPELSCTAVKRIRDTCLCGLQY